VKACASRQEKPPFATRTVLPPTRTSLTHADRLQPSRLRSRQRATARWAGPFHTLAEVDAQARGNRAARNQIADGAAGRRAGGRILAAVELHACPPLRRVLARWRQARRRQHINHRAPRARSHAVASCWLTLSRASASCVRNATIGNAVPVETICGGKRGSRSPESSRTARHFLGVQTPRQTPVPAASFRNSPAPQSAPAPRPLSAPGLRCSGAPSPAPRCAARSPCPAWDAPQRQLLPAW